MSGFENDVMFALNADFTQADNQAPVEANGLATNGQMWIGTTALNAGGTHINVGSFTSPLGTVSIGYSSPNITLDLVGGGIAIERVALQTGTTPIVPAGGTITFNGAVVAAGTNPVRTDGTGASTMALEIQTSQALAAADATKIGLSNFDSADFTVDANGFVTLAATPVLEILGGPGITVTGTAISPIINSVIFTDTTAATLAVDNGYNATAAGTYPMPATAAQGELIIVFCDTAGAVVLDCPALNFIRIGSLVTSSGGTATSTSVGDSLTLRYRLSSLTWEATSVIGTWLVA